MINTILTPWRLKWYPRLLLATALAALLLTLCTGEEARIATGTGRLGGDFPEFYGAGKIVAQGNVGDLYTQEAQRRAQQGLHPDSGQDGFIPFAYPPQMALYYSLFARLPYRAAFAVHTMLSAAFLLLAAYLLREAYPPVSRHVLAVFAGMVFFYPVFRALLGGQNTALSVLCVAAAHALCLRGRDFAAGICLGLLLFKPQFGLTFLCLYALAGRWRVVLGGAATAVAVTLGNTVIFGPDWAGKWLDYARFVIETSMAMESEKAVSFIGVFKNLALRTGMDLAWIGYALAAFFGVLLGLAWLRRGMARGLARKGEAARAADTGPQARPPGTDNSQGALLGLASAGAVLIAPHAYYYDSGLLIPAFLALAQSSIPGRNWILPAAWAAGFTQPLAQTLGMSPLFFLGLAAFFAMAVLIRHSRRTPSS